MLLALVACFYQTQAQSLIVGLDTLCIHNELQLTTPDTLSKTHYWGFCSAYLNNTPTGSSIVAGTGLDAPSSIVMQKDGNDYFIFAVNSNGNRDIIRYAFGNSFANVPVATNLGNLGGLVPQNPTGMDLIFDGTNWYGYILGGVPGDYHFVRIAFGNTLANLPQSSNDFGNISGAINTPQDLYVFKQGGKWRAIILGGTGDVVSLDFGVDAGSASITTNILTNVGGNPTGMWPVLENGKWYVFYTDNVANALYRIDFGNNLADPTVVLNSNLIAGGIAGAPFTSPRDVSIIKDCGVNYAFVTNEGNHTITKLTFPSTVTTAPTDINLGNFAGLQSPRYLSIYMRDKDNVFAYTTNYTDNSISRLEFNSCTASSIPSSTLQTPPPVTYNTPGTYNVYYVGDEGLPTMKVDCKLITILPDPYVEITADTAICMGDTIRLIANGSGAVSVLWDPVYNATTPKVDTTTIFVYPKDDYTYHAHLEFLQKGGCPYDTSVFIKVNKIQADAGPDVFVADGATTVLGGPNTSYGTEFKYKWRPGLYLNDTLIPNPTCIPLDVQAYYFEVYSDSSRCVAYDTMWVRTECNDINLPNAFNPVSDIPANRNFGLLNHNIAKLEFFKIFNRWGGLVFETTDPKKKWDGRYNNLELPSDNYVWIVDGYCVNGKRIRKQGTVLLVK